MASIIIIIIIIIIIMNASVPVMLKYQERYTIRANTHFMLTRVQRKMLVQGTDDQRSYDEYKEYPQSTSLLLAT
jgi:hypothetical protein